MVSPIDPVSSFLTNLSASIADPQVWLALVVLLAVAAAVLPLGVWASRRMGLLEVGAPDGETLAVGLGAGLVITTALIAMTFSLGRSSFTPIAVGFLASLLSSRANASRSAAARRLRYPIELRTALAAAAFLCLIAMVYAATIAPSPRGGLVPTTLADNSFYAILGRDLVETGRESWISPTGFLSIPGLPDQMWYHWGELWLAGAAGKAAALSPILARHLVVLPMLILAACALTGSLVRAALKSNSRPPFLLGVIGSVILSPLPLPGTFFSSWPSGLGFGITQYGMGAVIGLSLLYLAVRRPLSSPRWPEAFFVGTWIASLLPAHVLLAVVGLAGAAVATVIWGIQTMRGPEHVGVEPGRRRIGIAATFMVIATLVWGVATGHGLPSTGVSHGIEPFNATWMQSAALLLLGGFALLLIPIAWTRAAWRREPVGPFLLGASAIAVVGLLVWGARVGDFNAFHFFFGAIVVFVVPAVLASFALLWTTASARSRLLLVGVLVIQFEVGLTTTLFRLERFGAPAEEPLPAEIVSAISRLEPDAKVAYECQPLEEVSIWDPHFASVDASTGRRVIPLCFEADAFANLIGGTADSAAINPAFLLAPQRSLFATADAVPSEAAVISFARENGVNYLLADANHPNTLIPSARTIVESGTAKLLRIPKMRRTSTPRRSSRGTGWTYASQ